MKFYMLCFKQFMLVKLKSMLLELTMYILETFLQFQYF